MDENHKYCWEVAEVPDTEMADTELDWEVTGTGL